MTYLFITLIVSIPRFARAENIAKRTTDLLNELKSARAETEGDTHYDDSPFGKVETIKIKLVGLGPKAIPLILKAISDSNYRSISVPLVSILSKFGTPAHVDLVSMLSSPENLIRNAAETEVEAQAKEIKDLGDLLAKLLSNSNDGGVRYTVIRLTESTGVASSQLAHELLKIVKADSTRTNQISAARSLWKAAKGNGVLVSELKQLANSKDKAQKENAAIALSGLEPDESLLPILSGMFKDRYNDSATEALKEMGPLAKKAIPQLVETLKTNDKHRKQRTAVAIAFIDPKTPGIADLILDAWNTHLSPTQDDSLEALERLGPSSEELIPRLIKQLADRSWLRRVVAAKALEVIGPRAKLAEKALIEGLLDVTQSCDALTAMAEALKSIGTENGLSMYGLYKKKEFKCQPNEVIYH